MEETIKIVLFTLGTIAALAALVKWGIEKYFQKNEEVLRLKEQITLNAIKSIEKTMDKVGNDLIEVSKNMAELEGHFIIFQSRMNDYDSKNNELIRSYISLTAEVRKRLDSFENIEIYEEDGHVKMRRRH